MISRTNRLPFFPSYHPLPSQSKDIDAVESQRLERIQAARRIKRVKSTQSRRSYSADSRHEDGGGGSSCLPTCLRGQRRSDKDRLYRRVPHVSRQESSCSDFPSPDSNPPSYDGACRGRPRCNSGIEENAALLVDVTSSSHRSPFIRRPIDAAACLVPPRSQPYKSCATSMNNFHGAVKGGLLSWDVLIINDVAPSYCLPTGGLLGSWSAGKKMEGGRRRRVGRDEGGITTDRNSSHAMDLSNIHHNIAQ
ncbi:hypothetical protein RRG08_032632 [Elysia crispata]|uniref:Uncharacterized protein n=1 Tax=Elysia crispata TaxID=231223 RepID=A0AAE0XZR4_9GAST|nr:hypothetical protein RRG08_032632 [Elysia crispata]